MGIRFGIEPHTGKAKTGRRMYEFAEDFCADIGPRASLPFPIWFALVAGIPYRPDDVLFPDPENGGEIVARPKWLLDSEVFPALDCKKKSILIGAWAARNGFPFRFLAVSELPTKRVHHVFPEVDFGRGMVTADATFPQNRIGQTYPLTYAEELAR